MKEKIKRRWRTPIFYGLLSGLVIIGIAILFHCEWIKCVIQILQIIAFSWVIIGMIIYYNEQDNRKKQKHYQAWQAINSAQGNTGSGGRIQALEELNKDGVSLVGVDLSKAFLEGIELQRANLSRANLHFTILNKANLQGSDFHFADLNRVELQGANLRETDLREARNIPTEQLSKAKTLYKAKLDPEIEEQIRKKYPHLLENPR